MKLVSRCLCLIGSLLAVSFVTSAAPAVEPFADGERVTFLGDSITHGGSYHVNLQLYWDLRHPGSRTRLMNCGVSGGSSGGGVARWTWDAAPQRADRTFVMFGMNDVGRGLYHGADPTSEVLTERAQALVRYEEDMTKIADLVRGAGQRLVVMTPTPFDQYGTNYLSACDAGCNEPGLASCAVIGRRLAARVGAQVADLHRPLTEFVRRQDGYCFCNPKDRVHPRADGHLIVMAEVLKAMGEPAAFGGADVDAKGETKVEFEYAPGALPFPVSEDYLAADRVYPLTDAVNREILTVRNLPAGRYALKADGESLGTFTDGELLAGVNLALLPTPGAKRAKKAWAVSREVLAAQERLRSIVFVEVTATAFGADPTDFADVCEKVAGHVRRSTAEKRAYAPYYEAKLAAYRADKPQTASIRDAEDHARERLRKLGADPVRCMLCVERIAPR